MDLLALRCLTQHLSSVTGAELAPGARSRRRAVPHVSVVAHRPLVVTAAFGPDTLLAALARASHSALPLLAGEGRAGATVALGLSSVAHTRGAGVLLPLLTVLVLLSRRQTGVGHTLRTALAWTDHQVFIRFAGDWFTLGHRALRLSVRAHTPRTEAGLELLPVPVLFVLPTTRASVADTLGAALSLWGVKSVIWGTVHSGTGQGRTGDTVPRAGAQRAGRGAPLRPCPIGEALVLTGALGGDAFRAALVGRNSQTLTPLEVALRVWTDCASTERHFTVTGALHTGLGSPRGVISMQCSIVDTGSVCPRGECEEGGQSEHSDRSPHDLYNPRESNVSAQGSVSKSAKHSALLIPSAEREPGK